MKKALILITVIALFSTLQAKKMTRSLIELGPKAALYIGDDVSFGIGAEAIFNPVRNVGVRMALTEIRFGDHTTFFLNHGISLDGLFHIPMRELQPYVHAGFGFTVSDAGPVSHSAFSIRAGMGFNFVMNRSTKVFGEPGIIITDAGDNTDVTFRLAFGARFGILK